MANTIYFLRHGHTQIDRDTPIHKWVLSVRGETEASQVADNRELQGVDIIVSSTEHKAYQTAKPLADRLGKEIIQVEELSELDREASGLLHPNEYEEAVRECMTYQDRSSHQWETADHALNRFSKKIEQINREYKDKKILIVGHGMTMNLYFAKLAGELDHAFDRLGQNNFCDWGVVKEEKIIKELGGKMPERAGERSK